MTGHSGASPGCLMVGEYVDGSEIPPDSAVYAGEVVRPVVVATYQGPEQQSRRRGHPEDDRPARRKRETLGPVPGGVSRPLR